MGGAEDDLDALVRPDQRPRLLKGLEQALRQVQGFDDFAVVFAGLRADHAAGGGIGVFMAFDAAEPVHQVFRDHQKIRRLLEASGQLIRVQLIDGVEGLELDARPTVQFRKGHLLMRLRNHRFGTIVPVGVAGKNGAVPVHQHVVDAPGVHRQAFDLRFLRQRQIDAFLHMALQGFHVPRQMAVLFRHAVGEAVYFLRADFPVFMPAQNMPAG